MLLGLVSRAGRVLASSACVEVLELPLQTRMLSLIFVVGMALEGFWEAFGGILDWFSEVSKSFFQCFFECDFGIDF